ncbi:hypothetical protein BH09ACT10_BH09ACT10_18050 [soil metagenome]
MRALGILAAAFGFGVASAMIPILNVEAYLALNVAVLGKTLVVGLVFFLAVGTTIGKVVLFHGARAGREYARKRVVDTSELEPRRFAALRARFTTMTAGLMRFLDHPVKGPLTVLLSAIVGIPPLLAVAVAAGASKQNVWLFAAAIFVGRAIRFAVIALTVAGLLG